MSRFCPLFLVLALTSGAQAAAPPLAEQWVVVVAPDLRGAVRPLIEHRRDQLFRVVVLDAEPADKLRPRLARLFRQHPGKSHLLLVGAVPSAGAVDPRLVVPALKGTIGRMKGQPSDAGYGCLDETRLPTVAVGRFPARSKAEAESMVARTLALERAGPGAWRRRLTVLAGIPAYNAVVDRLLETLAFARFERLSPAWSGRAIYTSPASRFCPPDARLKSQSLAYIREGQAFLLYLGHSDPSGLYAGPTSSFLDRDDFGKKLRIDQGGSVFVTFGCNGCQLLGRDGEGYGVHAMRNPRGPAAVLGSHGVCYAAMVQLAADGLFSATFQDRPLPPRLGDCWLAVQRGLATGKIDWLSYRMLDAVDGDPRSPQATQRQEHLEMFVLLGDPALRLPYLDEDGLKLDLEDAQRVTPGKVLVVRGRVPQPLRGGAATVRLRLERTPASEPTGLLPLPDKPGKERDRALLARHRRANDFAVVEATAEASKDGRFSARLEVPARLPWSRVILRVHAATARHEAMAARRLPVARPPQNRSDP